PCRQPSAREASSASSPRFTVLARTCTSASPSFGWGSGTSCRVTGGSFLPSRTRASIVVSFLLVSGRRHGEGALVSQVAVEHVPGVRLDRAHQREGAGVEHERLQLVLQRPRDLVGLCGSLDPVESVVPEGFPVRSGG